MTKLKELFKESPKDIYVTLEAKVPDDDTFELLYISESKSTYTLEERISTAVKGSDEYQTIQYVLPTALKIKAIRLDFGNVATQTNGNDTIEVRSISFSNAAENITLSMDSIQSFFHTNEWIESFNHDGRIVTKMFLEIYDPFLASEDITPIFNKLSEPVSQARFLPIVSIILFATFSIFIFILLPPLDNYTSAIKISFVMMFIITTLLPVTVRLLNIKPSIEIVEKRELAKRPELEFTKNFARGFEAYFTDNFGLREIFISWGGKIKTDVFKASINPKQAMIGKDHWLYYNGVGNVDFIFNSYTRRNLLTEEELIRHVQTLEDRKKKCEESGIKYIRGFCPNAHTIYPENLPFLMKIQIKDTLSRADQVIEYLKKTNSDFKLIDPRPALFAAKKSNQIYRKLDSHWNSYGAFIAYQDLLNQTYDQIGVTPKSIDDFKIEWVESRFGDLVQMLAINSPSYVESFPIFTPKNNDVSFEPIFPDQYKGIASATACEKCTDRRKVLIFRDSFTEALIQFYSLHFAETIYVWGGYNQDLVDQFKPDIVIEIPVERYL